MSEGAVDYITYNVCLNKYNWGFTVTNTVFLCVACVIMCHNDFSHFFLLTYGIYFCIVFSRVKCS